MEEKFKKGYSVAFLKENKKGAFYIEHRRNSVYMIFLNKLIIKKKKKRK